MVIHKMDSCMEAVEFELDIGQKVFVGKLIVKFVLVLHAISLDLLLSVYL